MASPDAADDRPATLMREALALARNARGAGNHPFGALLAHADTGEVLLTAENTVMTDKDVTRHAELNLVSKASQTLTREVLDKAVLYTSTEPCCMCAGAIYWAGIRRVVYSCSHEKLSEIAGKTLEIGCREVFATAAETTVVEGPLLPEEGAKEHDGFWTAEAEVEVEAK